MRTHLQAGEELLGGPSSDLWQPVLSHPQSGGTRQYETAMLSESSSTTLFWRAGAQQLTQQRDWMQ